jgi:hypothetical protein
VKQVLAQLGPEEQARLLETLDKMIHFLEETEDTEENPPQRHREHRGS